MSQLSPIDDGIALIAGGTDNTNIGNEGDYLKTVSIPSAATDRTGSGTITSGTTPNDVVEVNTQGMNTIIFDVTGTWVGTMRVEGLVGTTWLLTTATDGSQSMFATTTANSTWIVNSGGFSKIRLRMSAYTSGSATVVYNASPGQHYVQVWNTNTVSIRANIAGDVADAASDIGNPVKIGAKFNSSVPAYSTGQRVTAQANRNGAIMVQYRNTFTRITSNATTTAKSGAGVLHSVIIGANSTGGTVTIYDNTAGSGTVIMQLDAGSPSGGLLSTSGQPGPFSTGPLGLEFSTGLTVVTAGSTSNDVTVVYQ